jgi:hypothetical protein
VIFGDLFTATGLDKIRFVKKSEKAFMPEQQDVRED